MFNKFENLCEAILESNKSDMDQLKEQMKEAFSLKDQNFSEIKILPDNTARMRIIVPENKQFSDDVFLVDVKNGKFLVNSLNLRDQKTTSVEKVMEYITSSDEDVNEPEEETPENSEEPKPEGEEEPTPDEVEKSKEISEPTGEPKPEEEEDKDKDEDEDEEKDKKEV